MDLIRFVGDGRSEDIDGSVLHLGGASGIDFTLCGITLDSDPGTAGSFEIINASAVTCPDCIAIIKACRGVKIKE